MIHWTNQSHDERKAAIASLDAAGLDFRSIAEALSITANALHGFCHRNGMRDPGIPRGTEWAALNTGEARAARIRAMDAAGHTPVQIAAALGTTCRAVYAAAARYGVRLVNYHVRAVRLEPAFAVMPDLPPETWAPIHGAVAFAINTGCMWPVGEAAGAEQMCCGGPIHKKRYCAQHFAMAYRAGGHEGAEPPVRKPSGPATISSRSAMKLAGVAARKVERVE